MIKSLSVVIPAYNEEENVKESIKKVSQVLKQLPDLDYEIIVVNDGSRDRTGLVAKSLLKKISHLRVVENKPNRGYGGSLKRGFSESTKEFIVTYHADNQFDFTQVKLLLDKQEQTNADIVSGVRVKTHESLNRRLNRWGWNTIVRAMFGYLATDVDCGFKLIRRSLFKRVNLYSNGAMVDTELYAGARARDFVFAEVPVTHLLRTAGKSTGANPKVILKAFRDLILFWWKLKSEIRVEKGRAIFKWEVFALIAIIILAAFLRLYQIDRYMTFLGDEGRDVTVLRDMIIGRKFTLIGPGTSIGNMYLGPLYYYLTLPSLLLSNFSPVGPAVEVAFIGLATIFLFWWIIRQWVSRVPAILSTFLFSISPVVITYSRSSWNPNVMPFFALLTMYGIWKVWKLGYWRWLIFSSISLAFVLNSHYLGLLLVPVIGIFWLLSLTKAVRNSKTRQAIVCTLLSLGVLFLLMSPLLLFDLRHDGLNYNSIKLFFTERQTTVNLKAYKAIPNIYPLWQQIVTSLVTAKDLFIGHTVTFIITLVTFLVWVYRLRIKKHHDLTFVLVWLIVALVGLGLYKQHIYDHYFGFIFPVPFLLIGFITDLFYKNRFSFILAIIGVGILARTSLNSTPIKYSPNDQLARTQEISRFIKNASENTPFNLALISKNNYDAGYRYFLDLEGARFFTIHEQLTDQLFVICETNPCQPIGHPLWEVAAFGWAQVDKYWEFPWGVNVYRLVHNPSGQSHAE